MVIKGRGFTLIEIVLVLAIASLLLVVVFMAVHGAGVSRRDYQRKDFLARLSTYLELWAGNHGGKYPTITQIDDPLSEFRTSFHTSFESDSKTELDPLTAKHYYIQAVFPVCDASQPGDSLAGGGYGFVSVGFPGGSGSPYKIRVCLEGGGEYWIGR
jgi:prepilin-type N-terminal cleavage/methylation domain-containing protein